MKILLTGTTGFIGTALCQQLNKLSAGDKSEAAYYVLTRDKSKLSDLPLDQSRVHFVENLETLDADIAFDAVINLAGAPIADKRWTDARKKEITDSRVVTTQALIDYFKRSMHKPKVFISGSAIGYYGIDNGADANQSITEQGANDGSFSSMLCQQWETTALQAESLGIRTCLLRTGIVLGKGGALKKMLPPFKLGLGGKIGSGQQWMPWIHIDDMVGIILSCLNNEDISGPVNATAPAPVTNIDFTKALAKALKRPAIFPMPAAVVKLLFGQMGEELLLSGKNVVPAKISTQGYVFKYSHVDDALKVVV